MTDDTYRTENTYRIVEPHETGWRLDLFLVHHFPQYSRTLIRNAIMNGGIRIVEDESLDDSGGEDSSGKDSEGKDSRSKHSRGKPGFRLKSGQTVYFSLPEIPHHVPQPENIPLHILYEDDYLAVIHKPADMVVHPSRGHWEGTLVSALAFHFGNRLSSVRGPVRPGIVHRLDRDTSGVILIAKDDTIHAKLAWLFENRQIQKEYWAIVLGNPHLDRDMIDVPIAIHPKKKEKMHVVSPDHPDAKHAQTFYEVIKRYRRWSTVRCFPKTGRTHQIRVHLAHAGYPILCDHLYGGGKMITREQIQGKAPFSLSYDSTPSDSLSHDKTEETVLLRRQALHAYRLSFIHPVTEKPFEMTAPFPEDMQSVFDELER